MQTAIDDTGTEHTKEDKIRDHAYHLWLAEGQPDGRAEHHWHSAVEAVAKDGGEVQDSPADAIEPKAGAVPAGR